MASSQHLEQGTQAQDGNATGQPFGAWSAFTLGAITTNSAIGLILTYSSTIPSGGSSLLFYGYPIISIIGLSVAVTLAELTAAFPDAGGQFVWAARLSPPKPRRFLAYTTAILSWAGAVCTGASVCQIGGELVFELVLFLDPGFQVKSWMPFLVYHAVNIGCLLLSLFESLLPKVSTGIFVFTACLLTGLLTSLFAAPRERRSARNFFTHFENQTGWSDGIAAMVASNSMNWCYACLDAIVHIADEIPNPRENIPRALMWAIATGFTTGMICILAFLFASTDYETQNSALTIVHEAFNKNIDATIAIQIFIFISAIAAMWGIHVWQSRLMWKMAENKGFPFHKHLKKIVGPPFNTPMWALLASAAFTAILSCLNLASERAFSSLISAALLFQYLSYAIPAVLLLLHGRSKIPHGRFWFPKLGYVANVIVVAWTLVALVFYCFPYALPVRAGEMNYVSVVLCVLFVLNLIFWVAHGREHFSCSLPESVESITSAGTDVDDFITTESK